MTGDVTPDRAALTHGALTKIAAAEDEVIRLAEGGRWVMRVPVREDADSDTILMGALAAAREALTDGDHHCARCGTNLGMVVCGPCETAVEAEVAAESPVTPDRESTGADLLREAAAKMRAANDWHNVHADPRWFPVADWLDVMADPHAEGYRVPAVKVARAYLGHPGGTP